MTTPRMTWREKRLAREEKDDNEGTDSDLGDDVTIVNKVFELPAEFRVPEIEVVELALGAKAAMF
jgi:hypothetical protein